MRVRQEVVNLNVATLRIRIICNSKILLEKISTECRTYNKRGERVFLTIFLQKKNKYTYISSTLKSHKFIVKLSSNNFDSILGAIKLIIEINCLYKNILILHGSSFMYKNKAYACIGKSGSGKTTIISTHNNFHILSDDTVILKKQNGKFFAYSSPFDNKKFPYITPSHYPLQCIFSLKQAGFVQTINELFEIKLKEILSNSVSFYYLKEFADKKHTKLAKSIKELLFNLSIKLIASTEIKILYFKKDTNISSFL